jgi:hypothetical protein
MEAKTTNSNLVAHSPPRMSSKEYWYFNSGCFKHMTEEKKYLRELNSHSEGHITFGDRAKGKVKGI